MKSHDFRDWYTVRFLYKGVSSVGNRWWGEKPRWQPQNKSYWLCMTQTDLRKKCKSLTWDGCFFQIILLGQLLWITAYPFKETLISYLTEILPLWPEVLSWQGQQTSCSELEGRSHTWQPCSRRLQYMPLWITQRSDKLPSNCKTQETAKTPSLRTLLRQQETVLEAKRKIWVSRKYQ